MDLVEVEKLKMKVVDSGEAPDRVEAEEGCGRGSERRVEREGLQEQTWTTEVLRVATQSLGHQDHMRAEERAYIHFEDGQVFCFG